MTTKRKTNRKIKNACREVKEYVKTLKSLRHSEYQKYGEIQEEVIKEAVKEVKQ